MFSPSFLIQTNSSLFFLAAIALSPLLFFVWERVQNKAKLILKSQASAARLACGRAPATCSLMPERGGARSRSLADCPPCADIRLLRAKVAKTYRVDVAEPHTVAKDAPLTATASSSRAFKVTISRPLFAGPTRLLPTGQFTPEPADLHPQGHRLGFDIVSFPRKKRLTPVIGTLRTPAVASSSQSSWQGLWIIPKKAVGKRQLNAIKCDYSRQTTDILGAYVLLSLQAGAVASGPSKHRTGYRESPQPLTPDVRGQFLKLLFLIGA